MNLSDEQKQTIAQLLADGASIADIQRLVSDEYHVAATYMETRFLIDDLNLDLKEEPKPEPEPSDSLEDAPSPPESPAAPAEASPVDEVLPASASSVTVEIAAVKAPGTALNGTVVFSDGVSATWYIDQMGRLGLDPQQEDYQPSPEDIEAFQVELQTKMQSQGF